MDNTIVMESSSKFNPCSCKQFEGMLKEVFSLSFDVVINVIKTEKAEAVVAFIAGLVNNDIIDRDVIAPLKNNSFRGDVEKSVTSIVTKAESFADALSKIVEGITVLYYNNSSEILLFDHKMFDQRAVTVSDAESVIRGPKEAFTENIATNTSLIRRKLKSTNLIIENLKIGRQSNTTVAIIYMRGIVNKKLLKNIKAKLEKIDTEAIFESGYIEQFLEDKPFSLVSTMGLTQKPDVIASRILEGRVAIMCDGTPHVLTIPELFIENFHTAEDYYSRSVFANILRIIRFMAFILAIFVPGLFLAVVTFHQEMIPFVYLSSFIASTQSTPLPEIAELLILMITFELIKEGGTRLPKTVGSAISIVGALVVGDAAVSAGFVGAPSVIVVALSAVSALLITNLNEYITTFRILFLVLGGTMGLVGIGAGFLFILAYTISKESYGIPVLSSFTKSELEDSLIRTPLTTMKKRPPSITKRNKIRIGAKADE